MVKCTINECMMEDIVDVEICCYECTLYLRCSNPCKKQFNICTSKLTNEEQKININNIGG